MAKQPKFLKNLLTTVSTVALLSLGATNAMAGNARGVYEDLADGTGVGLDKDGINNNARVPLTVAGGDTVKLKADSIMTVAAGIANLLAIDVEGHNFTFTHHGNIALGPIINTAQAPQGGAAPGGADLVIPGGFRYTLTGTPVAAHAVLMRGNATENLTRNPNYAAVNANDVELGVVNANDYSGLKDITIGNGSTLEVRQHDVPGPIDTAGKVTFINGKINAANPNGHGTLDILSGNGGGGAGAIPQVVVFEDLIGSQAALNKIVVDNNTITMFRKSVKMDGADAANGGMVIGNNSNVIFDNNANLTSGNHTNLTYVHGVGANQGMMTFLGASTIDVIAGVGTNAAGDSANALRAINIGGTIDDVNVESGKVILHANTPGIIADEIEFYGVNAELELGAVAQTVISKVGITGLQVAANGANVNTGIITVNGNTVTIKTPMLGGNTDATKLKAIKFGAGAGSKLILQAKDSGFNGGPIVGADHIPAETIINVNEISTAANNKGTLLLGIGTKQKIITDIGASGDRALERVVLHSDDGVGHAEATFDLAQSKKIYARTVNLSSSENVVAGFVNARNNKLVLNQDSGVVGNVEAGIDGANTRIAGNLGEIHVNGTGTFVTGNVGYNAAGGAQAAGDAIKAIIFDAVGDISIGTDNGAGNVVNTTDGIQFAGFNGTVKFLKEGADMTINTPIVIAVGQKKGKLGFAAGDGKTVTITGRVIENIPGGAIAAALNPADAATGLAMIKTAGANVSIDASTIGAAGLANRADKFIVDTIDVGTIANATVESIGGTLVFKTFIHGDDLGILKLNGGDIVVDKGGKGIGKLDGIIFSRNNRLVFREAQANLSLGDTLTTNNNGTMVFEEGVNVIEGVIGANTVRGKLGGIEVGTAAGANSVSLELKDNAYLNDEIVLAPKGNMIFSGTEYVARNIRPFAAAIGETKVTFKNTEDLKYTGDIGNGANHRVKTIEVAGGSVTLDGTVRANELKFTNKDLKSVIEFDDIADILAITTVSTDHNTHHVKIDTGAVANLAAGVSFGTKDNPMGALILDGDNPFNIMTANFYGSVIPEENNTVDFTVSAAGGKYYNVGTEGAALKSFTISENQTFVNVNVKAATVLDDKTVTFEGKVVSQDGMTLGTAAGDGKVKVVFNDGSMLNTKIINAKDNVNNATFNGSAQILDDLGTKEKRFAGVTITGKSAKSTLR